MKNLVLSFALLLAAISVFAQKTYIPDPNFRSWLQTNYTTCMVGDSLITSCSNVVNTTYINVSSKNIADLTGIEAFTALDTLYCSGNQLTSLNVSANTTLTYLNCNFNLLTSLNVSANTDLTYLYCGDNQLTSLDVSANTALTGLYCYINQLTSLNVSANTTLTYLECYSNQLTSLNVSANTALINLECGSNQLTSLNVSTNTALTVLLCYNNQLTSLNVSGATALTGLHCGWNQLTSLIVSANAALTSLNCSYNQLTSLDVKNGNNIYIFGFDATNNPNLSCINVDNAAWSTANWTNIDAGTYFSENCSTGISSLINTTDIKTYPNPLKNEVTVEILNSNPSTHELKLKIMNIQGQVLENINITDERITIDLSKLPSGLYTIKIITDNGIIVKKLIKN